MVTLKKWMVMSWVRVPPWEKFLCKTVKQASGREGQDQHAVCYGDLVMKPH